MNSFNDQRVVVLGGSSGIGLATAKLAAANGASVAIVSRSRGRIDAALEQLPSSAEGYIADLTSPDETKELFGQLGGFDHLVYTAGENLRLATLKETDLDDARGFLETRFWGALAAIDAAQYQIRPGGSIVLMSGTAGARPQAGWSIAAAICGAIEGLTRALAIELAPIRVNAVVPGVVRTELWASMPEAQREAMYAATASILPVGRVGEADEVAEAIGYLMSNGYTTGTTLEINGGGVLV
jgi:NAD(P)-dependent dehydrogenase (short-subunit alcohol dehydrogenase family)